MAEQNEFIQRLVDLRLKKGVSARDMSLSLGQSAGYINNIENGVNYPSIPDRMDVLSVWSLANQIYGRVMNGRKR